MRKIRLIIKTNTLSAGIQHLNWKFNVLVHRKTVIHPFAFAFAFVTGYLSCHIFLMTFWWPLPILFHSVPKIGMDWSASVWPATNIWTRSLRDSSSTVVGHLIDLELGEGHEFKSHLELGSFWRFLMFYFSFLSFFLSFILSQWLFKYFVFSALKRVHAQIVQYAMRWEQLLFLDQIFCLGHMHFRV